MDLKRIHSPDLSRRDQWLDHDTMRGQGLAEHHSDAKMPELVPWQSPRKICGHAMKVLEQEKDGLGGCPKVDKGVKEYVDTYFSYDMRQA